MDFRAPKNFNKGELIGGKFRHIDLAILLGGCAFSLISIVSLVQFNILNVYLITFLLLPAGLGFALTLTFGVYHNFMMFFVVMYRFYTSKRKFIWEGIYTDEPEYEEE